MKIEITSPILFLCFNRPEKTKQVFECIRRARPQKLYVAADAPRQGNLKDIEGCAKVREIVQQVDWPCETHYLFHDKNLGCTLAGKTAWDWLFSQEEDMIFLEDDGLVTDSFFWYAQELLNKYRNDDRIAYIGSVNSGQKYGDATYFFTHCSVSTYAMATWKRTYGLYDYDLESWPSLKGTKEFISRYKTKFAYVYDARLYDNYRKGLKAGKRPNTYDRQMWYLSRRFDKINIFPNVNQVTNIGFDYEGSNTAVDPNSDVAKKYVRERYELTEIKHPSTVTIDEEFDWKLYQIRRYGKPEWKAKIWVYLYLPAALLYGKIKRLFNKK